MGCRRRRHHQPVAHRQDRPRPSRRPSGRSAPSSTARSAPRRLARRAGHARQGGPDAGEDPRQRRGEDPHGRRGHEGRQGAHRRGHQHQRDPGLLRRTRRCCAPRPAPPTCRPSSAASTTSARDGMELIAHILDDLPELRLQDAGAGGERAQPRARARAPRSWAPTWPPCPSTSSTSSRSTRSPTPASRSSSPTGRRCRSRSEEASLLPHQHQLHGVRAAARLHGLLGGVMPLELGAHVVPAGHHRHRPGRLAAAAGR